MALVVWLGGILLPLAASAANKNVWITDPVNTQAQAQEKTVCVGSTVIFTATTSFPPGLSWSWSGAALQTVSPDQLTSTASANFAPAGGPYPVTAIYGGEISYAANITAVKVDITRDGNTITDQTLNTIVGERIGLAASVLPTGVTVSGFQWSIPGYIVGGYSADSNTGSVNQNVAVNDSAATFYWVDGGDSRSVTCSVTLGGTICSGTTTFNVRRPTAQITSTTGSVDIDKSSTPWGLRFGVPWPGIAFTQTITIPSGFSGSTEWVQLADPLRRRKKPDGTWDRWAGAGLDTDYPYSAATSTTDSPATSLDSGYVEKTANDSFTMYLMFQPSGFGSIFVPLRQVSWSWGGDAVYSGGTWLLPFSHNTLNPVDTDTTSFPEWTRNAANNTWQPE